VLKETMMSETSKGKDDASSGVMKSGTFNSSMT